MVAHLKFSKSGLMKTELILLDCTSCIFKHLDTNEDQNFSFGYKIWIRLLKRFDDEWLRIWNSPKAVASKSCDCFILSQNHHISSQLIQARNSNQSFYGKTIRLNDIREHKVDKYNWNCLLGGDKVNLKKGKIKCIYTLCIIWYLLKLQFKQSCLNFFQCKWL